MTNTRSLMNVIDDQIYDAVVKYAGADTKIKIWAETLAKTSSHQLTLNYLTHFAMNYPDVNGKILQAIAKNPHAEENILKLLTKINDPGTLFTVLTNPNCTKDIRKTLENSRRSQISQIAKLYSINDAATLTNYAKNGNYKIKEQLCYHPGLTEETTTILAQDRKWEIRKKIAAHRQLNDRSWSKLINDSHRQVVAALLLNPNITTKKLNQIAEKIDPKFAAEAARLWICDEQTLLTLTKKAEVGGRLILENPACTTDVIEQLKTSHDMQVIYGIAFHPLTKPETLQALANHSDEWVRKAVAQNPNTPVDTRRQLIDGPDSEITENTVTAGWIPENLLASVPLETYINMIENKGFRVENVLLLKHQIAKSEQLDEHTWAKLAYKLANDPELDTDNESMMVKKMLVQGLLYSVKGASQHRVWAVKKAQDLNLKHKTTTIKESSATENSTIKIGEVERGSIKSRKPAIMIKPLTDRSFKR